MVTRMPQARFQHRAARVSWAGSRIGGSPCACAHSIAISRLPGMTICPVKLQARLQLPEGTKQVGDRADHGAGCEGLRQVWNFAQTGLKYGTQPAFPLAASPPLGY